METEPSNPLKEIFEELFGLLESLETQSMAVTQFLKDQKIGNDKKLAPYLEQAGNASSVKWRAARVRMEYLLASMQKEADAKKKAAEKKESEQKEPQKPEPQPKNHAAEPDNSETAKVDQPPVNANDEPSKSSASKDAKPEKKEQSKPELERR